MDSRINIKLHPAELGELKIDLTVKEGAIRANVVAQSQQTVDILEKNIQKLKNMLEQQGYAVEQISLSAQSESVGDFDLFDQQLFGKNDATPSPAKNRMKGDDLFSLEESPPVLPTSDSGVNVKI
jgi:flagellar hook-length control protein FliK